MNERLSAHDEVCGNFRARYAGLLPEVAYNQGLDGLYQTTKQVESMDQALAIKAEQLTKDGKPEDLAQVNAARDRTAKKLRSLKKEFDLKTKVLRGEQSKKRLSKKLSRDTSLEALELNLKLPETFKVKRSPH